MSTDLTVLHGHIATTAHDAAAELEALRKYAKYANLEQAVGNGNPGAFPKTGFMDFDYVKTWVPGFPVCHIVAGHSIPRPVTRNVTPAQSAANAFILKHIFLKIQFKLIDFVVQVKT